MSACWKRGRWKKSASAISSCPAARSRRSRFWIATIRLLPGIVGKAESLDDESFETGLLEYPHYTRPDVWQGREVPEVLRSGHHAKVAAWRRAQAEEITQKRRPDLWDRHVKKTK